ncbi:MAG TPA: 50S ribosomal protein L4 [Candidatus Desulfovibrio intestinipullorum]|uniref:Large ribosomal subunit protein uL4 n=1 Tax=Candidatus Desulfovibrio intestinipullorum TaxID=2838536 RepID=A0A9D1TQB7_9BACT|nr:50S ribosomal protein L4 [Candidatus Desulfovibrio intestinipullorum]
MPTITVYNQEKQEVGTVELSAEVFGVDVRPEILNLVVRAQQAAKRAGTHMAKTRAYVSGGGVKPWKQKGSGRARAGSRRSPIWRGGAVIFGPQPRDYSFKVNAKVRSLAMRMALSSRAASESLMVVRGIELPEAKTKHFAKVAKDLGLNQALLVVSSKSETLDRSSRNLPGITLTTPENLSVYEILKNKQLVLLEDAIAPVQARFEKKGK